MNQEEQNNMQNENYQDPLATADNGEPAKKSKGSGGALIGSTIGMFVLMRLFGLFGALICYAGFWAVYAIARTKLSLPLRIILCILTAAVFIVLLLVVSVIIATMLA